MKLSVIIPAHNEEKTIGDVIQTLLASRSPRIKEVICVNDGSFDNTLPILKSFGNQIILINLRKNRGKGYAMAQGVKKAKGTLVLFLDADIINLQAKHIDKLVLPFSQNTNIKAVLGYPTTKHYIAKLFLPLTGERVYYTRDLLPRLDCMETKGYGVETYLNSLFAKKQIAVIPLRNLKLLEKHEKHGFYKSLRYEARATVQISKELVRREGLIPQTSVTALTNKYKKLLYGTFSIFLLVGTLSFWLILNSFQNTGAIEAKGELKTLITRSSLMSITEIYDLSHRITPYIERLSF